MPASSDILDRIMVCEGVTTDAKLAELFDVVPTTVSTWRKRNSVPYEKIMTYCEQRGLSLYYIFYGKGPVYKDIERESDVGSVVEGTSPDGPQPQILLQMAQDVLVSETDYAVSLAANIRSFHRAISAEKRLADHEDRLRAVEEEVKKGRTDTAVAGEESKKEGVI